MAALITKVIREPGIELTILSQSSINILRNLEEFSIDVGLTYFLEVMRPISDDRAVRLIDPTVEHSVGLVAVDRDPVSPMVIAAFECARVTEPPAVSTRS